MFKKKYLPVVLIISLFFLPIECILAGEVSPDLAEKISEASPSEKMTVLISLDLSPQTGKPNGEPARNHKTLAERHRVGIDRLKSMAAASQAHLLELLRRMESSNLCENVKSHWLINVISADIVVSEIRKIASRNDVVRIFQMPEIRLIEPLTGSPRMTADATGYIEPNLITIGADSAWSLGYTGEGRIICSFDTGIEGTHPAIYSNWKGHDGDSTASWYDPFAFDTVDIVPHFPHTFPQTGGSRYHGTHTMGIMVGYDSSNERHIGVAPGAKWISAAAIDLLGASIIDAFEWAADPDGNPNSINDVPDVINHSWGILNSTIGCHEYFWEMIDNIEALGIVNVFAAGNEGRDGPMTIRNPANRAFDSLDCFAVGAVNIEGDSIAKFSSRGPSDCDMTIIKPNVVAPGDDIVSAYGSSSYIPKDGTSAAAPHVSGAVAILRQYAPNATPDEIKEALLASCRRLPAGDSLPNNDYGWGLIYIPAALAALTPDHESDLRIYSFDYPPVEPGGSVTGHVLLKNFGGPVDSVYGLITSTDGGVTVFTDSLHFGYVEQDDTSRSNIEFLAIISDTVTAGRTLTIPIDLYGSTGYHCTRKLYVKVGESPSTGFFTHENDILSFTVSNFGQFGFAGGSFYPLGHSGFRFVDMLRNDLFEGALLIGSDSDHVSDGVRNLVEEPDNDFAVSPKGDLVVSIPGVEADQETFSIFDDSRAEHSLGLEIEQRTYFWNNYPDDNFVILEYAIKNISDSIINGIYTGLFLDWDLHSSWLDGGGFWPDENLGYMYHPGLGPPVSTPPKYRGIAVINSEGVVTHKLRTSPANKKDISIEESEKFLALSQGTLDSIDLLWHDLSQTISTGPFALLPGQSDTAVFTIVAADTLPGLVAGATRARNKYNIVTDVETAEALIIPNGLSLDQNYPNPFNTSTTIAFALSSKAEVKLSVYNILGEKVVILVDDSFSAGRYAVSWNGRDTNGNEVASGIYFCRIAIGRETLTRKMILLK